MALAHYTFDNKDTIQSERPLEDCRQVLEYNIDLMGLFAHLSFEVAQVQQP
jgi:hypothetical protein